VIDSHGNPVESEQGIQHADEVLGDGIHELLTPVMSDYGENMPSLMGKRSADVCHVDQHLLSFGLAWSAIPWSMMKFLSTFVVDLEKSISTSGLFSVAVFV
jgi:hypothetical protein